METDCSTFSAAVSIQERLSYAVSSEVTGLAGRGKLTAIAVKTGRVIGIVEHGMGYNPQSDKRSGG